MPPDQRAAEIAGKFSRYVTTRDETLIKEFSEKEVENTLVQYSADQRFPHYNAMALRLQELKDKKRDLLSKDEREKERKQGFKDGLKIGIITTIVGGIIAGIILAMILKRLHLG